MKASIKLLLIMLQLNTISLVAFTVKKGAEARSISDANGTATHKTKKYYSGKKSKTAHRKYQTEEATEDRAPVQGETPAQREMAKQAPLTLKQRL